LIWSSDSDEDKVSKENNVTVHVDSDSEEPTEFGVVWGRYDKNNMRQDSTKIVEIVEKSAKDRTNPWRPAESPSRNTDKDEAVPGEAPSPHLASLNSKLCLNKWKTKKTLKLLATTEKRRNVRRVTVEVVNSVPIAARYTRRRNISEGKIDNYDLEMAAKTIDGLVAHVPFANISIPETQDPSLSPNFSGDAGVDVIPILEGMQKEAIVLYRNEAVQEFVMPKGLACIGLQVARDFGANIGIFKGRITKVDMGSRSHHYHVVYDDGDEEDYDFEEMEFAAELHYKIMRGTNVAPVLDEEPMSDGEGSLHVPSDDEEDSCTDIHPSNKK
jgi:hypothetical protein